jgi:hypothetical protein
MIAAVQYVHHRGLLHLDIKPVRSARARTASRFGAADASQPRAPRQENFCVERDDVPLEDAKVRLQAAAPLRAACSGLALAYMHRGMSVTAPCLLAAARSCAWWTSGWRWRCSTS